MWNVRSRDALSLSKLCQSVPACLRSLHRTRIRLFHNRGEQIRPCPSTIPMRQSYFLRQQGKVPGLFHRNRFYSSCPVLTGLRIQQVYHLSTTSIWILRICGQRLSVELMSEKPFYGSSSMYPEGCHCFAISNWHPNAPVFCLLRSQCHRHRYRRLIVFWQWWLHPSLRGKY